MELGPFCSKKSETLEAIAYGSMVFMEKSCGKASSGEKSFLLLLPNVESKAFLSEIVFRVRVVHSSPPMSVWFSFLEIGSGI